MAVYGGQGEIVEQGQDAPAKALPLNDSDLNFCLVIPFGLQKEIYAWGASCIQSYLRASEPEIQTSSVDLRGEEFTRDLRKRYGPAVARILENLKFDQPIIIGQTPESALGVVAGLGDRFIPVARDAGLFKLGLAAHRIKPKTLAVIEQLAGEVEEYFLSKLREMVERNAGRPTLWGLSVYDCTIVPALQSARAIRKLDPASPIILGGGYFNVDFARQFVKGIDPDLIDGIVVGRGEEVVLQLLRSYRDGISIEQSRIAGFYSTRDSGMREISSTDEIAVFLPPETSTNSNWMPENPVVHENIVRVMPQVGCSWGKCTFCDHVDKDQAAFEILRPDFLSQLTEKMSSLSCNPASDEIAPGERRPVVVRLDGDEIDPETLARTIEHIAATNQSPVKTEIKSWLQIKKFTEELGHTLFECRHKIRAFLICNAESFNFDALRAMKKGHTPLQAAHVIKAMIDTGHSTKTNVFSYYPREGFRGVAEEVELVGRIHHLLCSPDSRVDVRTYAANEVDEVFHNQEQFQLTVRRRKGDVWLKNAFNVDLPLQHMSAVAQESRPFGLEGVVVGCYARAIESVTVLVRRHRLLVGLDPGRGRFRQMLRRLQFREILHAARAVGHVTLLYLVTRLAGKDYWRRSQLWLHIKNRASFLRKVWQGFAGPRDDTPSYFFLHGQILTKNHQGWGRKENWQYKLNDNEFAVLRYLYKVRKKRALSDRFRESIGDTEIEKILRRQVELGSVVESHGSLLCVVNDPEYWEYEPGHWD